MNLSTNDIVEPGAPSTGSVGAGARDDTDAGAVEALGILSVMAKIARSRRA